MRRVDPVFLTLLAALGGCHKQTPPAPQAQEVQAPAPEAVASGPDTSQKGKAIPTVEIKNADGQPAKLSDLKGKPFAVSRPGANTCDFFSTRLEPFAG